MSFEFLDIEQASKEYLTTNYFQQMDYAELIYRLNCLGVSYKTNDNESKLRNKITYHYTLLVKNFNVYERHVIEFYFKYLFDLLWKKAPRLIPQKKKIGLIKL